MSRITEIPLDNRIIATYASSERVSRAKTILETKLGLGGKSIITISPQDSSFEEKLESKSSVIGAEMLRTHIGYAGLGLLSGILIAFFLIEFGPAVTRNNPLFTAIAFISPGLFIGTFAAGLKGLRPQHDIVNLEALKAKDNFYWTLIVKPEGTAISKGDIVEEIDQTECIEVKK